MTPAEKARDLIHRFYISLPNNGGFTGINNINSRWAEGKQCALMAVNEIIYLLKDGGLTFAEDHDRTYWLEVKQEIEKI
jgi:hypothetical protein